ncbi:hypothetical protein GTP55_13170 [Duganella sp. FT109W]|uniref:Uncharacterized protein n=1 Tax=Duganella margarita TaxID=2692170 RepID=A0ABW9WGS4_9BURK|nr:hypothetical protein [Duganella margarita]MYN40327.1 hypothetical protein [Duganella margarita]
MVATSGVVLDLGWLAVLDNTDSPSSPNHAVVGGATKSPTQQDAIYRGVMADPVGSGLADLLLFAEHLVVHEFFIIDSLAFQARLGRIPLEITDYVIRKEPDLSVYTEASKAVIALTKELEAAATESEALKQLRKELSPDGSSPFWSGADKRLHDHMERSGGALRLVASAASTGGDTLSRALFYLEFSRRQGDVALLGPGKRKWLQLIGHAMEASMHELIAKKFDDKLQADLKSMVPTAFSTTQVTTPPVAELVLRTAIAQGISILDAAVQIRESADAQAYRALLGQLRSQMTINRATRMEATRLLAALDDTATLWAKHHDTLMGITHQKRELSWEKIPLIGDILKAAGMSKTEIRDRILNPQPGHLAFISRWYRRPD